MVVADPAVSEILPEATPEVTATVCTVTVAPPDVTVGVTVTDATLFGTVVVYDVVPDAKATLREPSLRTSALNVLTVFTATALVTVTVYVLVVTVSSAVTTTAIAVSPTLRGCALDTLPEVTALPPTVTVPLMCFAIGVNTTDATSLTTVIVYAVVAAAKVGDRLLTLLIIEVSVASVFTEAFLVTAKEYVVVDVSPAVTTTVTVTADPAVSAIADDVLCEATDDPCTVTVADESVVIGVTVTDGRLFGTETVYEVVAGTKFGVNDPSLSFSSVRVEVAVFAAARDTSILYFDRLSSPALTTTVTPFVPASDPVGASSVPVVHGFIPLNVESTSESHL
jgi:hypothetical protein